MDIGKKFIALTIGIFIAGYIVGTICGIGIGGMIGRKTNNSESAGIVTDLRSIADMPMYPNYPVALWDKNTEKYRSSAAIEELYGSWKEQNSLTLSDIKTPYKLVVFESPLCPVCFVMHSYLRDIRQMFATDELEILIINPPALSEESAEKATATVRNYLSESDESVKKAYITQDRNNFRYVSLRPEDQGSIVQTLGITDIPYVLLLDSKMRIIYRTVGYTVGNESEREAFTRALNALLKEIRTELNGKEGAVSR